MKTYIQNIKKILSLLPKKTSKKLYFIFFLLSVGGLLESLSISIFLPLITLALEGKANFYFLENFYDFRKFESDKVIKYLLILIFFVYLLKSTFLTFLDIKIQKFIQRIFAELTGKLFSKYINHPYKFYLSSNSSILLRNLSSEVLGFANGIIAPLFQLAREFFIICIIIIMLFTFDPAVSLFVVALSILLVFVIKNLIKNRIKKIAKLEQDLNGEKNKTMLETIQGIKFVKAYQLENVFVSKFFKQLLDGVKLGYKITVLKNLPRLWIEVIIVTALLSLAVYFNYFNYSANQFLTFISLFLLAMLKVLPAILSTIRSLNTYSASLPAIDLIKKELNTNIDITDENEIPNIKLNFEKKIKIFNISFKYEGQKKNVLDGLSLEVNKKNDIIGIYGPSGAGKTTLIDILIGLYKQDSGEYQIDGKVLKNYSVLSRVFGYVPQSTFLFDDTIKNNILVTAKNQNISEDFFNSVLEESSLKEFIMTCKEKENTRIGENGVRLSGGQRQRIGIARALIAKPDILIFDEATNALDVQTERNIFETMKTISTNKSIVIVSHNTRIWEYCNKIFKLEKGKLISNEK